MSTRLFEVITEKLCDAGIHPIAARKTACYISSAIEAGLYNEMLHPDNKNSRHIFTELTGVHLPKSERRTIEVFKGVPIPYTL